MDFVVVTGQSGAGRSQAANYLEDLGWFVIDNLPTALIPKVSELAIAPGSSYEKVALVAGGGLEAEGICGALRELRTDADIRVRVVFLQASTRALVSRYESSKRPHPWGGEGGLEQAIDAERAALEVVKAEADMVIDTTNLSVHQLRDRIEGAFGGEGGRKAMSIRVTSFGYKHGMPVDVDLVFDVRFLPNPHWVDELRPLTGRDQPVANFLAAQLATPEFLERLFGLLDMLVPAYEKEGKSYLTIAFGCTGGQHRSVWVAAQTREHLEALGYDPRATHRDIER